MGPKTWLAFWLWVLCRAELLQHCFNYVTTSVLWEAPKSHVAFSVIEIFRWARSSGFTKHTVALHYPEKEQMLLPPVQIQNHIITLASLASLSRLCRFLSARENPSRDEEPRWDTDWEAVCSVPLYLLGTVHDPRALVKAGQEKESRAAFMNHQHIWPHTDSVHFGHHRRGDIRIRRTSEAFQPDRLFLPEMRDALCPDRFCTNHGRAMKEWELLNSQSAGFSFLRGVCEQSFPFISQLRPWLHGFKWHWDDTVHNKKFSSRSLFFVLKV